MRKKDTNSVAYVSNYDDNLVYLLERWLAYKAPFRVIVAKWIPSADKANIGYEYVLDEPDYRPNEVNLQDVPPELVELEKIGVVKLIYDDSETEAEELKPISCPVKQYNKYIDTIVEALS